MRYCYEYELGSFNKIKYPFKEEKELSEALKEEGYHLERSVGCDQEFEIWCSSSKENKYEFWGIICFGSVCNEIGFQRWIDVLHFLENYTSWIFQ